MTTHTYLQLSPVWIQLKLVASDGKKYATDCATAKELFRIIKSIPSPQGRANACVTGVLCEASA